MVNAFKKQVYVVYFRCIDPNGEDATADCMAEALTATQAKSWVMSSAKANGFSRVVITECRTATDQELAEYSQAAASQIYGAGNGHTLH